MNSADAGSISHGALMTIYGANLATSEVRATQLPLPTDMIRERTSSASEAIVSGGALLVADLILDETRRCRKLPAHRRRLSMSAPPRTSTYSSKIVLSMADMVLFGDPGRRGRCAELPARHSHEAEPVIGSRRPHGPAAILQF